MKTVAEVIKLANLGVDLVIDSKSFSADEVMQIAYAVNARGTHLTLLNASAKSTPELVKMAELLKTHLKLSFENATE